MLRSLGGVTLLRVAMELRGISCHEERDYEADPDSISCSRSFGKPATTKEALAESLASFTAQAAAKLRRHGLLAAGCNVYAQILPRAVAGTVWGVRSFPPRQPMRRTSFFAPSAMRSNTSIYPAFATARPASCSSALKSREQRTNSTSLPMYQRQPLANRLSTRLSMPSTPSTAKARFSPLPKASAKVMAHEKAKTLSASNDMLG